MQKKINIVNFHSIGESEARIILRNIEHNYGELMSVCALADRPIGSSFAQLYEIGVVDIEDLGLEHDTPTFEEAVEKSMAQGYSKIILPDFFAYLKSLSNYNFDSQGTIILIMDKVFDAKGLCGVASLHLDENGTLYKVNFMSIEKLSVLPKKTRFLVKKSI